MSAHLVRIGRRLVVIGGAGERVDALLAELDRVEQRQVAAQQRQAIKVLDRSYIDLTTPMGRGFMAMMSAMAEDERLRIISRTHEGRQIAQAKGVRMGRKPELMPHQKEEALRRIARRRQCRLAKSYAVASARFRGWELEGNVIGRGWREGRGESPFLVRESAMNIHPTIRPKRIVGRRSGGVVPAFGLFCIRRN